MRRSGKGTALITGASSGIGAAFARRLAREGYDLVITGRREQLLADLAREIGSSSPAKVETVIAELSADRDLEALLETIHGRDVSALVNNAGYGQKKSFLEDSIENQVQMVQVHVLAAMRLAYAVVPGMIERGGGIIINVSSMASFFPLPRNCTYCSTKAFLRIFSETLHIELRRYGILVQAICPGFTRTDFHARMGTARWERFAKNVLWMDAAEVARISLRTLGNGKVICIPGAFNKFLATLRFAIPKRAYYRMVSRAHSRFAGK